MVILENIHPGIALDRIVELFQWATALATQMANGLGGMRGVALLAIAGFTIGLVACMLEIKMIKR